MNFKKVLEKVPKGRDVILVFDDISFLSDLMSKNELAEMGNDMATIRHTHLSESSKMITFKQCNFKTSSKTILTRHIEDNHKQTQEMRIRHQCDKCDYKTTSKGILTQHMVVIHETKEKKEPKLKSCGLCGKRFNKII